MVQSQPPSPLPKGLYCKKFIRHRGHRDHRENERKTHCTLCELYAGSSYFSWVLKVIRHRGHRDHRENERKSHCTLCELYASSSYFGWGPKGHSPQRTWRSQGKTNGNRIVPCAGFTQVRVISAGVLKVIRRRGHGDHREKRTEIALYPVQALRKFELFRLGPKGHSPQRTWRSQGKTNGNRICTLCKLYVSSS
jgi:hypothetical protein